MEEVVGAFLSTPVGKAIFLIVVIVVGALLREWTYRNRYGYNNTWSKTRGADLKAEAGERKRLQREMRKKYAYLSKKGSNESIGSKVVTKIKKLFNHGNK